MSEGRVKIHFTETQKAMMAPGIINFPTKENQPIPSKRKKLASKTKGRVWQDKK